METMIAYMVSHYWNGLANSSMTDEERKILSPSDPEYRIRSVVEAAISSLLAITIAQADVVNRVNGSKTHIVGWCSYTLVLWATKGSMCTSVMRITKLF